VLISDAGIRGLVVLNRARAITFRPAPSVEAQTPTQPGASSEEGKRTAAVKCESGASLSTLAQQCVARGFGGLEWAAGIPGTVGGAVVGNAGAWGGDMATTLVRATVLQEDGMVVDWPVGRFEYGYRTSLLKQQGTGGRGQAVVLEAEFKLEMGEQEALEARVAEILAQRKATQPPGATCGSVFKNPAGDYAGRLIDAAGLKGQRRGRAEISPVHANFIVNRGDGSAADVKALIDLAYETVRTRFDVGLELEIELIGEWSV
jgi:UDP-N-acetylmuramate dehydrogenase